jgi:nitronate monooxygenase
MLASGNGKDSWKLTRAAHLLGIDYPIIMAPFGGLPSQRLTAAVSNLGGLGSLGAVTLSPSAITEVIGQIRSLTSKPFAINLWVSTSDREASHISSDRIEEKIREFRRYYTELGIELRRKWSPSLRISKFRSVQPLTLALQCSASFMESHPRKY